MYQLIASLNQEGISIIMVSHDMQAIDYASHVLHMDKKKSFYGTKEEYIKNDKWNLFQQKEVETDA